MRRIAPCPVCGAACTRALPNPARTSLRSDGFIAPEPLRKASCLACGSAFRTVRRAFCMAAAEAYSLNAKDDNTFDQARQQGYASLVQSAVPRPPRRVLDLGCGNGALLAALGATWPDAVLYGVEPATLPRDSAAGRGLDVRASPRGLPAVDLVASVNVIEHTPDPAAFLADIARALVPGGHCVLVWPADAPANMELLFNDHLFTLPARVVEQLAGAQGLHVQSVLAAPAGFQGLLLRRARRRNAAKLLARREAVRAIRERRDYLRRWADLDGQLIARLHPERQLIGFGLGEGAQALRAQAPRSWACLQALTADSLEGQRALCLPLVHIDTLDPAAHQVLLTTHPRSQARLAQRFAAAGIPCVRWDDIIEA